MGEELSTCWHKLKFTTYMTIVHIDPLWSKLLMYMCVMSLWFY